MASSSSSWKEESRNRLEAAADTDGLRALKGRNVNDDICVILGRPTLWVLLTYEESTDTIWPGFSKAQQASGGSFKFKRIYGRAAKQEPKCDMQEAVAYGWRECILPWICQERLEEDVLCVLLEEDWRPWQTAGNEEDDPRNCDATRCLGVIRSMVSLFNVAAQLWVDMVFLGRSIEKKTPSETWSHGDRPHRGQSSADEGRSGQGQRRPGPF